MSQGLCPSCGAAVNLTAEQNETNCTYCGSVVTRQESEARAEELKNAKYAGTLILAQTAQEGGSYTEALSFWNKIIEQDPNFSDAWLEKGNCMVRTSKIGDLKIPEAVSSWKAAIKFSKNQAQMKKRIAKEIVKTIEDFYPVLENHFKEFSTVNNAFSEFISRFTTLESALALALEYDNQSQVVCRCGISLCDRVLSAPTSAGVSAAFGAGDWKGALNNIAQGYASKMSIQEPVLKLKAKYMEQLVKLDPNYKANSPIGASGEVANTGIGASKKVPAGICGILLGALGIHKFIIGYKKEGIIMLLVTILTLGFGGFIMGLIGLIEGIIYLTKSDADFVRIYVEGKKGWF